MKIFPHPTKSPQFMPCFPSNPSSTTQIHQSASQSSYSVIMCVPQNAKKASEQNIFPTKVAHWGMHACVCVCAWEHAYVSFWLQLCTPPAEVTITEVSRNKHIFETTGSSGPVSLGHRAERGLLEKRSLRLPRCLPPLPPLGTPPASGNECIQYLDRSLI